MIIARVYLRENIKNRIRNGHPWIYEGEIWKIEGDYENGDVVDVFYHSGDFLGRGYINDNSKIRIRLLTRRYEEINGEFFKKKLKEILSWKVPLIKDSDAFRVIFSEADGFPGFVVDKYGV
jgi:23S rRNA (cytosine1962-C5)-methyltransferase